MRSAFKKKSFLKYFVTTFVAMVTAFAAHASPLGITYQGRIVDDNGVALNSNNVDVFIRITSPTECTLYQEQHIVNFQNSDGLFSINVGSGTRFGTDPNLTLENVFINSTTRTGLSDCISGSAYTPALTDSRKMYVSFDDGSGLVAFSSPYTIRAVPYAFETRAIGGFKADNLCRVANAGVPQTIAPLTSANYTELLALINGTSTQFATAGGGNFSPATSVNWNSQRITNLGEPTSAQDAATRNYTDTKIGSKNIDLTGIGTGTGDGRVLTWDATNDRWVTSAASSSDATKLPLAGGTMSGALNMGSQNITSTGFITMSANRYLGLGSFDATAETDLITNTLTAGGVAYKGVTWFNTSTNTIKFWNGSAPVAVATGSTAISSLNGSSASSQSFATPGSTGTAPAWSTNAGTGVHTLNIPLAADTGVTAGLLSKAQYDALNAKMGNTLNNGQIFVGNASNVATGVALSGDATLANTGALTVTRVQNRAVATTTPLDGQVFHGMTQALGGNQKTLGLEI